MPCVSYVEQQLFQVSNVPRSPLTNMNDFEYQRCQGSTMLSLRYENINYVMTQILKLSCVSFSYVSISSPVTPSNLSFLSQLYHPTMYSNVKNFSKGSHSSYNTYIPWKLHWPYLTRPWAFLSVSTFGIRFCQLNFYQNLSKYVGGESWHQSGYFEILLNFSIPTKSALWWRQRQYFFLS